MTFLARVRFFSDMMAMQRRYAPLALTVAALALVLGGADIAAAATPGKPPSSAQKTFKKTTPFPQQFTWQGNSGCLLDPLGTYDGFVEVKYNDPDPSSGNPESWRRGAVRANYYTSYDRSWSSPPMSVPPKNNAWAYYSSSFWCYFPDPPNPQAPPTWMFAMKVTSDGDIAIKQDGNWLQLTGGGIIPNWTLPLCGGAFASNLEVYYRKRSTAGGSFRLEYGDTQTPFTTLAYGPAAAAIQLDYAELPQNTSTVEGGQAIFSAGVKPIASDYGYAFTWPPPSQWQEAAPLSGTFQECGPKCVNANTKTMTFNSPTLNDDNGRRFRREVRAETNSPGFFEACWLGDDVASGTLTVTPKPTGPLDAGPLTPNYADVNQGDPFAFQFTPDYPNGGSGVYYYQWYFYSACYGTGWDLISGATSASYTKNAVFGCGTDCSPSCQNKNDNRGNYICQVTDNKGAWDNSTASTVFMHDAPHPPPVVANLTPPPNPPTPQTVAVDQNFTFTVKASGGSGAYSYQWYFAPADNPEAYQIITSTSAKGSTYTKKAAATDAGNYRCQVLDTSKPQLEGWSDIGVIIIPSAFTVDVDPVGQDVVVNNPFTFTANVSGGQKPYSSYQWKFYGACNGTSYVSISGATGPSYTKNPAVDGACLPSSPTSVTDVGNYQCCVTDSLSQTACSLGSTLTVSGGSGSTNPLTVEGVLPPSDLSVEEDHPFQFSVTADGGTGSYRYAWYFNACNDSPNNWMLGIPNSATYSKTGAVDDSEECKQPGPTDIGRYKCLVTANGPLPEQRAWSPTIATLFVTPNCEGVRP